jgi:hypothetical protein
MRLAPIWISIPGITVSSVGHRKGLTGGVLMWAVNWPPFELVSSVATDTLTTNS